MPLRMNVKVLFTHTVVVNLRAIDQGWILAFTMPVLVQVKNGIVASPTTVYWVGLLHIKMTAFILAFIMLCITISRS